MDTVKIKELIASQIEGLDARMAALREQMDGIEARKSRLAEAHEAIVAAEEQALLLQLEMGERGEEMPEAEAAPVAESDAAEVIQTSPPPPPDEAGLEELFPEPAVVVAHVSEPGEDAADELADPPAGEIGIDSEAVLEQPANGTPAEIHFEVPNFLRNYL